MRMRIPVGSSWFSTFFDDTRIDAGVSEHDYFDDVSSEALGSALDALSRGEIEFVILEAGDDFVQAAGDGDGRYQLEHFAEDGTVTASADASFAAVAAVFNSYMTGDEAWRAILGRTDSPPRPSTAPAAEGGPVGDGRSRLRRLFRR